MRFGMLVPGVALVLSLGVVAHAQTPGSNIDSYIEVLRSDVQARKTKILAEALKLDDAEAAKFWPIQREYETDLARVLDRRVALIHEYAEVYAAIDDEKADDLARRALAIQKDLVELREKYYKRIRKAVGARRAARFVQVESTLDALMDIKVGSALPLIP